MNILPKKRWHVRTKENIARVRKDEAEAAEKERQEKLRIEQADRELRLNILKKRSKENLKSFNISDKHLEPEVSNREHINLFGDIEHAVNTTNKDHEKEVKEKKEEYEKKIGYLTYLGQDTNEALGKKNWYDIHPESSRFSRPAFVKDTYDKLVLKDEDGKPKKKDIDIKNGEIGWKSKQTHDPINAFRHLCYKTEKQRKEAPSHTSTDNRSNICSSQNKKNSKEKICEKEVKLQKLREARLKREQQEKHKTDLFLTKFSGGQTVEPNDETPKVIPKYNSQFNPELARQNYR